MLNKIFTQTLAIALMVAVSSFAVADNANDKAIESFLAHVDKMDSVSAEKKAEIKAAVKEMAADPYSKVDAITEGLGILYPEYKIPKPSVMASPKVWESCIRNTRKPLKLLWTKTPKRTSSFSHWSIQTTISWQPIPRFISPVL